MKLQTVALVGRPNVGKSTIFNRMVGKKISIIEDTPGVTRDRVYGKVEHGDYQFHLIDTGGIDLEKIGFNDSIRTQVELALDEADVIVFIVDGKDGLTSNDMMVRNMLLRTKKRVVVAVNKMDNKIAQENFYDFYELGFDEYIEVSGEHNFGVGFLLDSVVRDFQPYVEDEDDDILKFSVIGRPNVGKSSLINSILNEERVIVSDIPGTTRDAVDTSFMYHDREFVAIDTAGMRKRGKVYESIEKYSVLRALKAIDRSDVCLVVINAEEGIIEQDKHIAGYAEKAGKAIVLVVNKWDVVEDKNRDIKYFTKLLRSHFQFLPYAPIVFLSALTKKRIHTLMPEVLKSYDNAKKEIGTSVLNSVIMDAVTLNPPAAYKGKKLKIYFSHQSGTKPPTFTLHINSKGLLHFSYERYLENKLRESFDFEGTPIILKFKNKGEE